MSRASAILAPPVSAIGRDLPMLRVVSPPMNSVGDGSAPSEAPLEKLELTTGLAIEIERESERLEAATPPAILEWATERFAGRFTMATAFGPEGMVLIHMLAEI